MTELIYQSQIEREKGKLYFIDENGNVVSVNSDTDEQEITLANEFFTREDGWTYFLNRDGNICRSQLKTFKEFVEVRDEIGEEIYLTEKNWIAQAIKHPGRCTPMSKPGCTGHARALAMRFKKGGDLHKKKK